MQDNLLRIPNCPVHWNQIFCPRNSRETVIILITYVVMTTRYDGSGSVDERLINTVGKNPSTTALEGTLLESIFCLHGRLPNFLS
jgi:hypothetical protein